MKQNFENVDVLKAKSSKDVTQLSNALSKATEENEQLKNKLQEAQEEMETNNAI